jgi:hypothetical protein
MRVLMLIEDVPERGPGPHCGSPPLVDVTVATDSALEPPPATPALRLARRIAEIVEQETTQARRQP